MTWALTGLNVLTCEVADVDVEADGDESAKSGKRRAKNGGRYIALSVENDHPRSTSGASGLEVERHLLNSRLTRRGGKDGGG